MSVLGVDAELAICRVHALPSLAPWHVAAASTCREQSNDYSQGKPNTIVLRDCFPRGSLQLKKTPSSGGTCALLIV